jgi:hypothetical protein
MPIESHRDVYLGVVIHFSTLSLPGWATTCYFIGGGVGHNTTRGAIVRSQGAWRSTVSASKRTFSVQITANVSTVRILKGARRGEPCFMVTTTWVWILWCKWQPMALVRPFLGTCLPHPPWRSGELMNLCLLVRVWKNKDHLAGPHLCLCRCDFSPELACGFIWRCEI